MLDSDKTDRKTSLYRHYDAAGRLLYVGISFSAITRTAQHAAYSPWWDDVARMDVERFSSRAEAEAAEIVAIREERPLFNKRHAWQDFPDVGIEALDTPEAIRAARQSLGLSTAQLGAMLETDAQTIRRMEQRADAKTFRKPAPRMLRLLRAYLGGWRPDDWPVNDTAPEK